MKGTWMFAEASSAMHRLVVTCNPWWNEVIDVNLGCRTLFTCAATWLRHSWGWLSTHKKTLSLFYIEKKSSVDLRVLTGKFHWIWTFGWLYFGEVDIVIIVVFTWTASGMQSLSTYGFLLHWRMWMTANIVLINCSHQGPCDSQQKIVCIPMIYFSCLFSPLHCSRIQM